MQKVVIINSNCVILPGLMGGCCGCWPGSCVGCGVCGCCGCVGFIPAPAIMAPNEFTELLGAPIGLFPIDISEI